MISLGDDEWEQVLRLLWKHSIVGLALVNPDGTFRSVSPAFCRIVEYTSAELKKMKFQDITLPSDTAPDMEMGQEVMDRQIEGYDMTKSYITKSRRVQTVLLRVSGLEMNDQFICFVSQILPASPVGAKPRDIVKRDYLKQVRENWQQILVVTGAVAMVLSEVVKYYKG